MSTPPVNQLEKLDAELEMLLTSFDTSYAWNYGTVKEGLRDLYEKAKREQWNGTTQLPWDTEVDPEGEIIPAVVNDRDLKGYMIAALDNLRLSATHQVVFVDKGKADGVKDGNRFFAVEKRDGLRRINNEPNDHPGYPTEVIAEMRVVEARPHTSTCLITGAIRELEIGQRVEMRKGY